MKKFLLLFILLNLVLLLYAQAPTFPAISAANVRDLKPYYQINYTKGLLSIGPGGPPFYTPINAETGWFLVNTDGNGIALLEDNAFSMLVWNYHLDLTDYNYYFTAFTFPPYQKDATRATLTEQGLVNTVIPTDSGLEIIAPFTEYPENEDESLTFVDGVYDDVNLHQKATFYGVYTSPNTYRVQTGRFGFYDTFVENIVVNSADRPKSMWLDCNDPNRSGFCDTWLEMETQNGDYYVTHIPFVGGFYAGVYDAEPELFERFPYAPAQDPEAVVRIGRISPPYVVTSSLEGVVKLWNIQTGETLYTVNNGTGEPSVFGNINHDASHLVWRDNASKMLYLLDFTTGENRLIAKLGGAYVQWFFLSNDASVILGVNMDFEPHIYAWIVETGERLDLGAYRHCERPQPDMARLSADGSTLIIGCDTGLDIFRIVPD